MTERTSTVASEGWKDLAFPREEYEARIEKVRRTMADRSIEVLLIFTPENVNYLTGYDTIGYSSALPSRWIVTP